jgi:hypothetical protein
MVGQANCDAARWNLGSTKHGDPEKSGNRSKAGTGKFSMANQKIPAAQPVS